MSLLRFLLVRLASGLLTLLLVSVVVFAALHAVPGGYEDVVLGPLSSPELRQQTAEKYGLDQPVLVQYWAWLSSLITGDLGTSLTTGEPVLSVLGRRIAPTAELVAGSMALAIAIGIPLGVVAGLTTRHRSARAASRLFGSATISIPDFVVGTALVYLFSANDNWFRVGGYVHFTTDPIANLRSMGLPIFTLGLFGVAVLMRTQRDSVANVITQPFITAAVSRGTRPSATVRRHVMRNSSIPSITIVAVLIGAFFSGSVVVETLFSVPGIGNLYVTAVQNRDYAVVQGAVLISSTIFVVANMTADMLYAVLDPRITSPSEGGA